MKDSSKGQTLLEVILAIGVAALVLIGLTRAVTVALRNAQFAKKQALATQYAQEGMEKVRAYRDQTDWTIFTSNCDPGIGSPAGFSRSVNCSVSGGDRVEVTVTVSWDSHKAEIVSFLTKWK